MSFMKVLRIAEVLHRLAFIRCLFMLCLITFIPAHVHAGEQNITADTFAHWLDAAYIAQATYDSSDDITEVLGKQGYKLTKSQQIPGYAVSYILATNDAEKRHLLAVRGTANIENIMVDAAFVLVPDKLSGIDIHQGFLLTSRDIYEQVIPVIKPGYKIDTIGHSLGGASALILAMMLDAQGYPVGEVITFGQPKVTNITGSRKFGHMDIKRLVNARDVVPLVPPADPVDLMKLSIFWHQGTEIVLYQDNRYSILRGMDSMLRAADFLNDVPSERHIDNHFMTTYIKHLKAKLQSPEEVKYKSDFNVFDWFGSSSEKK